METTTSRSTKRIVGYCDPLSVEAGSTVRFMVSSLDEDDFQAQLVRLVCGDVSPGGHGFAEEQVASAADGTYAGRYQPLRSGSCAIVAPHPLLAVLRSVRVDVAVWPTAIALSSDIWAIFSTCWAMAVLAMLCSRMASEMSPTISTVWRALASMSGPRRWHSNTPMPLSSCNERLAWICNTAPAGKRSTVHW